MRSRPPLLRGKPAASAAQQAASDLRQGRLRCRAEQAAAAAQQAASAAWQAAPAARQATTAARQAAVATGRLRCVGAVLDGHGEAKGARRAKTTVFTGGWEKCWEEFTASGILLYEIDFGRFRVAAGGPKK